MVQVDYLPRSFLPFLGQLESDKVLVLHVPPANSIKKAVKQLRFLKIDIIKKKYINKPIQPERRSFPQSFSVQCLLQKPKTLNFALKERIPI